METTLRSPAFDPKVLIALVAAIGFGYALSIMGFSHESWSGFPLDDAWIHLVYGRSVAESGMLAYNDGIPATGCTSVLWALLLGVLHLIFSSIGNVVLATKILGALLHGATAAACFKIVAYATDSSETGFIVATFVGVSPPLAMAAVSGMEIALGCAVCMWAICCLVKGRFWLAGVMLAGACMTRPEFAVVGVVAGAYVFVLALQGQVTAGDLVKLVFPSLLVGALVVGRNLHVDGRPFPATFYEKALVPDGSTWSHTLLNGIAMLESFTPLGRIVLALGGLGLVLGRNSRPKRIACISLCAGLLYCVASLTLIFPVDPKSFYHIRYLLPSVPLLAVALGIGIAELVRVLASKQDQTKGRGLRITASIVIAAACMSTLLSTALDFSSFGRKLAGDIRNINEVQVALGKKIDRCLPAGGVVATVDAGAVRYFGKRKTIDLVGLNTSPDFVESGVHVYDQVVDIMCLLPAWVGIRSPVALTLLDTETTANYAVTMNPKMARQDLVTCIGQAQVVTKIVMSIRRRFVSVPVRCGSVGGECWKYEKKTAAEP